MIKNERNVNAMDYRCGMIMVLRRHGNSKGILRTKFSKEGEKCNIPDLGNPNSVSGYKFR